MKVVHKFPHRYFKGFKQPHVFKKPVWYLKKNKTTTLLNRPEKLEKSDIKNILLNYSTKMGFPHSIFSSPSHPTIAAAICISTGMWLQGQTDTYQTFHLIPSIHPFRYSVLPFKYRDRPNFASTSETHTPRCLQCLQKNFPLNFSKEHP